MPSAVFSKGLKHVPVSLKVGITLVLLLAGVGYLLGFLNIYLTYSPVDQQPGLSVQDVRLSFWGSRGQTVLESAIDGSMRQYFQSDADYNTVKNWIRAGGAESDYPPVQAIFEQSCNSCHSAEAAVGGVVLATYPDVAAHLQQDTGKSIPRLVSLTHTHLLPTLSILSILVLIFAFTAWPERMKTVVIALCLLVIPVDLGSWWLAKLSPALSVLVILGGIGLALSFLALIVFSFYDLWLRREAR